MLSLLDNIGGINELETSLRGAAGAASDMATKQLDTLKGAFTELKSAISGVMLTIGEMAAPAIKDFAVKAKEAIPALKDLITNGFAKLKQTIKDLSPTFTNLKEIFEASVGIVKDIFAAFKGGNEDAASLTDVINTLTGSLKKVFVWIDEHPEITKFAVTLGLAVVAFAHIIPVVTAVVTAVSGVFAFFAGGGTIISGIGAVIAALGGPITLIIAAVIFLAVAWKTNLFGIRDKTALAVAKIKSLIDSIKTVIANTIEYIKTAPTKIKEIVGKIVTAISDKMTGLATSAKDWGKNMITSFIDGIKSNFTGVTSAVKEAAGIVGDYLGFSSPTKEGPGKDVMKWGPNMVQAFAEGVSSNIGAINGAFGSLATPAFGARALSQMAGVPAPSQTTQINISFRDPVIRDEADIDKIVNKIEKQLVNNIRGVNII
jgi:phage-related protein